MNIEPGTVILWKDFELSNYDDDINDIWFLYLGRDGIFDCPIYVYCQKITSQIQHYIPGGDRCNSLTIFFTKNQFGIFKKECIISFNEIGYKPSKEYFDEKLKTGKIEILGKLPEDKIRQVWNCLKKSRFYNRKTLVRIRDGFSYIGIKLNL